MGAYNRVNGEPSCASEFLMGKLDKWGFDGYFVSDCWAIRDFHEHHMVTSSPVESAAMALKAGCNVNCGCTYVHLLSALDKGLVTEDEIRASCVALMRTRIDLVCLTSQRNMTTYHTALFLALSIKLYPTSVQ